MLPWIWLPLIVVFLGALRAGPKAAPGWLLACLAAGPICGFTLLTILGRPGLPHWTAPGYFFLFPLLGVELSRRVRAGSAGRGAGSRHRRSGWSS